MSDYHLSDVTKMKVRQMLREISELESVGDACYNMARILNRRHESGHDFNQKLYHQLHTMMTLTDHALTQMNIVMSGHASEHDIRDTYHMENDINMMFSRLKVDNINAVNEGDYDYDIGMMYFDLLRECEYLGNYVVNVVEARLGK